MQQLSTYLTPLKYREVNRRIILHRRLTGFLETINSLYKHQYSFRHRYSRKYPLITVTGKVRQALDSKEFICVVFLDFQKAFNTIKHHILLEKLKYYGIRGITYL